MRTPIALLALVVIASFFSAGCAGPERKLGRGLNNLTEFMRGGEIHRSMEQTALWDGSDTVFTTGFIRGVNRSVARTAVGFYEVVTFPIPSYEPAFTPKYRLYPDPSIKTTKKAYGGLTLSEHPVYPQAFKPGLLADQIFATDTALGFSGGDIAPMIIGSRFRVFEY